MASPFGPDKRAVGGGDASDPFLTSSLGPAHMRYSQFDEQMFALGPGTSAEQARRALQAHLKDTERRMAEAGKLGTALVQQQRELTERLREVEQLESEEQLNPDLRQKLAEIEKDYNEVARESARAFLPKQRVPSNEAAQGSPFAPEGKGGRRSVSPSKFESTATGSPTKLSVPNRKIRNQPANRIHDIEFAAEISTSLISQVRNLQALLAERDEELRDLKVENAKVELDLEGLQQKMKSLDESEHRYKDENWNLETQIHDLIAMQKEAADREKKLKQSLNVLQSEKNSTQRELDEVKDNLAKQDEKHTAAIKNLEIELGTSRRNAVQLESERFAMQKKVEDLTAQNQELARAFSVQRGRTSERESGFGMSDEDFETADDRGTPEHSPPPSPVKGTPRHSMLESETLKTSLHHAQRTLQSLKNNIHREKTEKLELKRMLQEARDELEKMRNDPNAAGNRRSRKVDSREFKKPARLGQLGGARSSKTELYLDDGNWEDQGEASSPVSRFSQGILAIAEANSDQFETAHETSDAFETAHERGTETEDFQTGAEELSDEDAATETEASPSKRASMRRPGPAGLHQPGNRLSFLSTASTSNDEEEFGLPDLKTPPSHSSQKMRLRVSRGALNRRSRQASEEPTFQSSPASFANSSTSGTPQAPGQSLYAEIRELEGSDDDSYAGGGVTPSRRSVRSLTPGSTARWRASPPPEMPALPKTIMVDTGVMTEPVDVRPVDSTEHSRPRPPPLVLGASNSNGTDDVRAGESALSPQSVVFHDRPVSMQSVLERKWLGDGIREGEGSRPLSLVSYSDASAQYDPDMGEKLAQFPSPPTSPPRFGLIPAPILPPPQRLTVSSVHSQQIEPRADPESPPRSQPNLSHISIVSQNIEPVIEPQPLFSISAVLSEHVEPIVVPEVPAPEPPVLSMPALLSQHVQPIAESRPAPSSITMSTLMSQEVEPISEVKHPLPRPPVLTMPQVLSQNIEPLADSEPTMASPVTLSMASIRTEQVEPVEVDTSAAGEREVKAEVVTSAIPLLSFSQLISEHFKPHVVEETPLPTPVKLAFTALRSEEVEPVNEPGLVSPPLSFSAFQVEQFEPRSVPESEPPTPAQLSFSPIQVVDVEPVQEAAPETASRGELTFSMVQAEEIQPQHAQETPAPPLTLALIRSLAIAPEAPVLPAPLLGFSSVQGIGIEPAESRSPKRNAFIIPRDSDSQTDLLPPRTPPNPRYESLLAMNKTKSRAREADIPIIAEDETRQSPSASVLNETPDSQRPFKELSGNTDARPTRKLPVATADHGAQTALTAEAINHLLQTKQASTETSSLGGSIGTPSTVRIHRAHSRENSFDGPPRKGRLADAGIESRRPGSSASVKGSISDLPPLPANHREAIEAAKTGSSSGGQGTIGVMGPPLFSASAMRNQNQNNAYRPRSPTSPKPMSPISATFNRGTPTPRGPHGAADVHLPGRARLPSHKSSVSSFASEIDSRFNIFPGMGFDTQGLEPPTDHRMIQAITQTMIGEYLWKYTRKPGRGEMSENRHRRYFWVHPYTRTLYWSDRDPSGADRSELRAKSVPIEAVRVVTDDNPMPPGLHRKSLVVIAPGRSIKFTCTTGQRHEIWFNALSYLLLRTNDEQHTDAEEMAGHITREDVAEFNPSYTTRPTHGTRPVPPPSLSSYNSRTTRNESPALGLSMNVPTLTPSNRKTAQSRPSMGTLGRISGYWKESKVLSGTFGSLRSRGGTSTFQHDIYEASQVHDSAEDLREIIERQDREADRLENVRACCDGKHDVGTLPHSSKRGRHMHPPAHSHADASTTPTPSGTLRSRA